MDGKIKSIQYGDVRIELPYELKYDRKILKLDSMLQQMSAMLWYAIKNIMEEIAKTRWIPVSERLPKEKGWYNVTYNKKGEMKSGVAMFFEKFESDVVAWRPLPEPWKGEENDK